MTYRIQTDAGIRHASALVQRRSDGALFEPSYPDDYHAGAALVAALSGDKPSFYFRRVTPLPRRWWQRRPRWRRTGEVWQPATGDAFTLYGDDDA